jgi:hypothetical protein
MAERPMTLSQILRRIRRQRGNPPLTPWARRFLEERKHNLDAWTEEELEAEARRVLETPENERLLREDDEIIRQRRARRRGA